MSGRVVRIFLSSTFRDFGEERDLLVRKVFPTLRAKLQSRFVDLVDVDLRWGITQEEAERGEVLPICLSEIDRARPYFVGFLGERYGWVPPPDAYPPHVLESQSWLEEHRGGKSVTELEILHGVLNNPYMEGRALFYFRSFEYSSSKGGDYIASSPDDEVRQSALKETIRQSGFPLHEDYKSPELLAELLEKELWEILDREFPASDIPDAFVRENLQHEAYALPRQRLYIGGDQYLAALDRSLSEDKQWILIDGPSGGGKSALLANWLKSVSDREEDIEVHAHYLGATADATDPIFLVRRLIECIKRKTENTDDLVSDPDELLDSLPTWLANASSWCEMRGKKFLFVIDALNGLSDRCDLRWFPQMLPKHIHLVISTLPGEVNDALQDKADWSHVSVMPLDVETAELVFTSYLALFNKTLPGDLIERVMAHTLVVNPLFLLTLAEELRLFGEHEQLSERLDYYLSSLTVDDLFERVLERIEGDYGAKTLKEIMSVLWAARAGLREEEILGYSGLKPMQWAYIRNALGPSLIDASGRLIFAHDYMRIAVSDRYMAGNNTIGNEGQSQEALKLRCNAHSKLAKWFESHAFKEDDSIVSNERAVEEIPHQLQNAKNWKKLQTTLTSRDMLVAILKHRSEQELLSYWLTLEAAIDTDIETQYEKAWKKWGLDQTEEATGNVADIIADFLCHAGRYQHFTEKLLRLSLNIKEKVRGPEHPDMAKSLNNLGEFLREKGDYDEAQPLYRASLKIREKIRDTEHSDIALSLNDLGHLLMDQGDYIAAEPLLRRSLEIRETALGPEHPDTATSLNNLSVLMRGKGDYEGAELISRRVLDIYEKIFGSEHPNTALGLNNLCLLLREKGENKMAERLFGRVLEINEKSLGPEHPVTAKSLGNLGLLLSDRKNYNAAEPLFKRSLEINEKVLGREHPDTATSLGNLGMLLYDKKDYNGAELLLKRSLKINEKVLGEEHPSTAMSRNNLGFFLQHYGDYDGAEALYRHSLDINEKVLGPEHSDTATVLGNLGDLLHEKNDYDGAEPFLRRSLKINENVLGKEHPELAWHYFNIAVNYQKQNKQSTAEEYYRKAKKIEEHELGPGHEDIASTYYNLGKVLANQKKFRDAEQYFEKTLNIELRVIGGDDPEISLTFLWLGNSQYRQENYKEAEGNLKKAYKLLAQKYGKRSPELERVLNLLLKTLVSLGKEGEAEEIKERLTKITP